MKIKILLFTLTFALFFVSTLSAQVETTAKEVKTKVEKKAEDGCCSSSTTVKKADINSSSKDCSSASSEMKKGEKMMKKSQKGCDDKTAHAEVQKGEKMMKKAHAANCDCEGCSVAKAEMKKANACGADHKCDKCAKA